MNIIHIRTSTEEQNPKIQLKDCLSIYNKEWGEYKVFEEQQSAWKDYVKRPVFDSIKQLIKQGKVRHYIVWDFDRSYRDRKKFKEFLEYIKAFNTKLHSYRQNWIEDLHKVPPPWNEIVYELMINIYGHIAEEESKKKSDRVKLAVRKKGDVTISYKGNKWGRKALSTQKINVLKKLYQNQPKITIRELAAYANVSKSVVHKYLTKIKGTEPPK